MSLFGVPYAYGTFFFQRSVKDATAKETIVFFFDIIWLCSFWTSFFFLFELFGLLTFDVEMEESYYFVFSVDDGNPKQGDSRLPHKVRCRWLRPGLDVGQTGCCPGLPTIKRIGTGASAQLPVGFWPGACSESPCVPQHERWPKGCPFGWSQRQPCQNFDVDWGHRRAFGWLPKFRI